MNLHLEESVEVLVSALASDSPHLQASAARRLGERCELEAAPALCAALGDDTYAVRREARLALERMRCPETPELLLQALALRPWRLRAGAARRAGERGVTESAAALRRALSHARPEVIVAAIDALGRLQCREAANDMAGLLFHESPGVRFTAAKVLGELGGLSVLGTLRRRLRTFGGEPDFKVRNALRSSLRGIELRTLSHADFPVVATCPTSATEGLPVAADAAVPEQDPLPGTAGVC